MKGLSNFNEVRIPRSFRTAVVSRYQLQLHFFAGASSKARGAVCYAKLIFPDLVVCRLVMAKSHVNGSGKNTIPRLELEAVLDAIKLSKVLQQELGLQTVSCFFWTDSTVVIHSLRVNVKRFTLFPRNRLQRILFHSRVYDRNFEGTKANPADKLVATTSYVTTSYVPQAQK